MKQRNDFFRDMLDIDAHEATGDIVWTAGPVQEAREQNGAVVLSVPFYAVKHAMAKQWNPPPPREHDVTVRAYGDGMVRLTMAFSRMPVQVESEILAWDPNLKECPLSARRNETGWELRDPAGNVRFVSQNNVPPASSWIDDLPKPDPYLTATIFPDGHTPVPLTDYDRFLPETPRSLPLGYVERDGHPHRMFWSFHAQPNETFAGTGERFDRMDLAGRTLNIENVDALGSTSPRTYKNIPFYLSSRPYGLFALTSAYLRLSLAGVSACAAQGMIEHDCLDLFIIGGDTPEQILFRYRQITGFPPTLPKWSYGIWMGRMSYCSKKQVLDTAERLRAGRFPCDVMHLDAGWFEGDPWRCNWEFSPKTFPDPKGMVRQLRQQGYRLSLWQVCRVLEKTQWRDLAVARKYVGTRDPDAAPPGSIRNPTPSPDYGPKNIDFSNPEAAAWYRERLDGMMKSGASVIKTDFGEDIESDCTYHSLPYSLLHNLYPLPYQRIAWEATVAATGEGITWARSAWAGAQRYPLHWAGDPAASWDGMAGVLRGGLHLGASGFAFWSHDVPGFHGVPDFRNSRPSDNLYVRWTQFGVFTSHIRYHGACPREPYEYPAIADLVRQWWRLRYALIPYFVQQAARCAKTGMPLLRALLFHHHDDPLCWGIDDQFYCGDSLLVAPVMNDSGVRDVYLPDGEWVNVWDGSSARGPVRLRAVQSPLDRIPVYAVRSARIPVYPRPVQCTDEMDDRLCAEIVFDSNYAGLSASPIGETVYDKK